MKVRKYIAILHPQMCAIKSAEPFFELKTSSHIFSEVTLKPHFLSLYKLLFYIYIHPSCWDLTHCIVLKYAIQSISIMINPIPNVSYLLQLSEFQFTC